MTDDTTTYTEAQVEELISQLNTQNASYLRTRYAAMVSGGYDLADTLHNVYADFGYPASLSFFNYWNMFRRFGIAKRVVLVRPEQTWLDDPIVTSSSQFESELNVIVEQFGLWRRLHGLDTRQRVGRYGGLFMRVRDGQRPDQPLEGTLGGIKALVDMIPLYESQLKVLSTDTDPTSDTFGMPTMYQFNSGVAGNRNERDTTSFSIHPSRIIIASEDSDNSNIYGVSALEAPYNSLMDLRKILGAGGEGFYRNAAQSVVFNLQDGASARNNSALLQKFNENFDDFTRNRMRRAFWTPGLDAKALESRLSNPKEFFEASLADISAAEGVPTALLIGNQTGRLAGDQDTKAFLSTIQARRLDFATDTIKALIDWLVLYGLLPRVGYEIEWPDALALSSEQKLNNASVMSDINAKSFNTGQRPVFTTEEIREMAGYEMLESDVELTGEEIEDDEEV